ncbi:MAG: TRAP transporter small permease [Geminicoccaceae bacterium]|nr:TRAP transporter small permease [Geminicoccaceae bacterium]
MEPITTGPLARFVGVADTLLERLSDLFAIIANLCLLAMLVATAATIVLRPFNISFYWLWPWSMQVFVWMSFFGFFVICRRHKDIAVDFLMRRLGPVAMAASRWLVALIVLLVIGTILYQMPRVLRSQVGGIDGVITPWGGELQRYTLTIPLAASCLLIFVNGIVDLLKAKLGWPEPVAEHHVGDE